MSTREYLYEKFAEDHLDFGGLRKTVGARNVMVVCCFHDDNKPSMSFNLDTGLWLCFSCGEKGNIVKLAKKLGMVVKGNGFIPELDNPQAELESLDKMLDNQDDPEARYEAPTPIKESVADNYRIKNKVQIEYFWHMDRGLSIKTIEKFRLGFDSVRNAATIPMRNNDGELLGIAYRNLAVTGPKYHTPFNYRKTDYLYAFWPETIRETDRTGEKGHVVLVEGQIDAMKVWEAGYNVGAIMGSGLSVVQRKLLLQSGVTTVTLFFDDDKPGFKMALSAMGMLGPWMQTYAAQYDYGVPNDPGGMNVHQIRHAIGTRIDLSA